MGYELHITRASEWSQSASEPITSAEWIAIASARPGFVAVPYAEATTPAGDVIRVGGEHMFEWRGNPAGRVWFTWFRGHVSAKNPDELTITEMRAIAEALGARVQGDEGEYYDEPSAPSDTERPGGGILSFFRRRKS